MIKRLLFNSQDKAPRYLLPPAFAGSHGLPAVEECGCPPKPWRRRTEASAGYAVPQVPRAPARGAPLEGPTFINLVKIISRAEVLKNFPVLISACLLDISCRYDGRGSGSPGIISMASSINIIPFCPEQLGGLSTPRPPARIVGGDGGDLFTGKARVINSMGEDVTNAFRRGAEESLRLARLTKAKIALLKDRSPSCGLSTPYCDSPGGLGVGVTATLLNSFGIRTMEIHKGDGFPTQEFIALFEELYGISPAQPGLSG